MVRASSASTSALRQPRVAARVELHGLGEQHGALPVDVDAAALVDERRADDLGAGSGRRRGRRCARRAPSVAHACAPQPLKTQSTAPRRVPSVDRTKVGPMSRIHASSSGGRDELDVRVQVRRATATVAGDDDHADRLELDDRVRDGGPRATSRRPPRPGCRRACSPGSATPSTCARGGRSPTASRHPAVPAASARRRDGVGHCPASRRCSSRTGAVRAAYESGRRVERNGKSSSQSRRCARSRSATRTAASSRGAWTRIAAVRVGDERGAVEGDGALGAEAVGHDHEQAVGDAVADDDLLPQRLGVEVGVVGLGADRGRVARAPRRRRGE